MLRFFCCNVRIATMVFAILGILGKKVSTYHHIFITIMLTPQRLLAVLRRELPDAADTAAGDGRPAGDRLQDDRGREARPHRPPALPHGRHHRLRRRQHRSLLDHPRCCENREILFILHKYI